MNTMNKNNMDMFIRNQFGVTIRKCCSSCAHKDVGIADHLRDCRLHQHQREKTYVCSDWTISRAKGGLNGNVNLATICPYANGRVLKPQYVHFMQSRLEIANNMKEKTEALDFIRKSQEVYSNLYGDKCLIHEGE